MQKPVMSRRAFLASAAAGTATVASLGVTGIAVADEAAAAAKFDPMSQLSDYHRTGDSSIVAAATPEEYIISKGDGVLAAGGGCDALEVDPADFMLNVPVWLGEEPVIDDIADVEECDVLVIGAGNAGTVGALRLQEAGYSTILAEMQTYDEYDEYACDMTCYNNSLFLGKGTPYINPMEIFNEYMNDYAGHAHQKLVRDYVTRGGEMFDWMLGFIPQEYIDAYAKTSNYKGNANYDESKAVRKSFRGMVQWRDVDTNINMWPFVIRSLFSAFEGMGGQMRWGYQGVILVHDENGVSGAIFRDIDGVFHQINAKAVLMTAGDFGGNPDMRLDLSDQMRNLAWSFGNDRTDVSSVGGLGRDGSGIKMCMWAGATMEAGPRPAQSVGKNGKPGLGFGGCWPVFGPDGKRFFNESLIKHGTNGFLDMLPDGFKMIAISDANWEENLSHQGYGHETMDTSSDYMMAEIHDNMAAAVTGPDGFKVRAFARFGVEYDTLHAADTLEEVWELAGGDPAYLDQFLAEVAHWNEMCEAGEDSDWGIEANLLMPIKDAPFYFGWSSTGGNPSNGLCQHAAVCTDENYNVLYGDKTPIPGLFAGGNNCGQRMGVQYSTPTAGNSCGSALTSGYCAAEGVMAYLG